jgi:FtsP/CotA-like multicopper oxidase with cupredoxin domain
MTLAKLSPDSYGASSPAVGRRDPATLLVQGWCTENPGIDLPPGEDVVTLPALLAVDAVVALDGDMTFVDLMRTFATSAFRLEARQSYAADDEAAAFTRWQEHGHVPAATDPLIAAWTGMVRARVAHGAVMRRVHVVSQPMTEYVRFELMAQRAHSVPAGEQVRVVDADGHPDLAHAEDFWLLDDRVGVRLIYDDDGQLIRLERMTTGEVDSARCIRDAAWAAGTDLIEVDAVAVT